MRRSVVIQEVFEMFSDLQLYVGRSNVCEWIRAKVSLKVLTARILDSVGDNHGQIRSQSRYRVASVEAP